MVVDYAADNGDETCVTILRMDGVIGTLVAILRGEGAEYVAAMQAKNEKLRRLLQWYVDNDDTNEGEGNEYWLEKKWEAINLLARRVSDDSI
jgi:hypothetical protein